MTTITRWNPFRELQQLQKRMDQIWDSSVPSGNDQLSHGDWYPSVDIFEKGNAVVIRAELPGMKKDDIDVSIENNILTLKGKREIEKEVNEADYHRIERSYGSFIRSFSLPKTVDADKVKASYNDGILELSLPKSKEAEPKKIEIKG